MYTRNLLIPTIFRTGCGRLKGARRIQVAEQLIDHVLSNYIVTSVLAVCSIFTILWLIGTTHSIYKSGNQFLNRAVLLFLKYLFVAGQLAHSYHLQVQVDKKACNKKGIIKQFIMSSYACVCLCVEKQKEPDWVLSGSFQVGRVPDGERIGCRTQEFFFSRYKHSPSSSSVINM